MSHDAADYWTYGAVETLERLMAENERLKAELMKAKALMGSMALTSEEYQEFGDLAENEYDLEPKSDYVGPGCASPCLAVFGHVDNFYRFVFNFVMDYSSQTVIDLIAQPPNCESLGHYDDKGLVSVWYWPNIQVELP